MKAFDRQSINKKDYDILIIGAGIYGAWAAYCATLRGYKVLLIDKNDYASGTSSASSKLIHGGLRYLKEKDFKLVKKSLEERKTLQKIAPQLISPLDFIFPIYKDSPTAPWMIKIGLMIYDFLAGKENFNKHYLLENSELESLCPSIKTNELKKSYIYQDGQIDDAFFTGQIIQEAKSLGADTVNYLDYKDSNKTDKYKVDLHDQVTNEDYTVHAKIIINCTGRWAKNIAQTKDIHYKMTKGIHLTLPSIKLDKAFIFTASDERVFFLIPWHGRTLIGTTDTFFDDPNKTAECSEADIQYLFDSVNHYFKIEFQRQEVLSSWAGIRVLKEADGSESSLSRDIEFKKGSVSFYTPIGGKITSARADTEKLLDLINTENELQKKPAQSQERRFSNAPNGDFQDWKELETTELLDLNVDQESTQELLKRYGSNIQEIKKILRSQINSKQRIITDVALIYADLIFQAQHGDIVHLDDLLRRRLPLTILARLEELPKNKIQEALQPTLNWPEERWQKEFNRL